ncbi:MAG: CRISPR-associated protein Cas4 [Fusicatenibacter sp.]|nr:CRISPR-associated protein Cas4 [Fusicatenibacter sp.]
MLSGIQHFVFCRRQWALIHIEQQWEENYRTVDGNMMHKHAHDDNFHEKRGDLLIVRGMAVSSPILGISGECDIVEFKRDDQGVPLHGQEGNYSVTPVEYKRGSPKADESDKLQLTAQAMCLEDMLCCEVPAGYLYYGETKHRVRIELTEELRAQTRNMLAEMHEMFQKGYTPKAKRTKSCNACSLKNICLPVLGGKKSASAYINMHLHEDDEDEKIT